MILKLGEANQDGEIRILYHCAKGKQSKWWKTNKTL